MKVVINLNEWPHNHSDEQGILTLYQTMRPPVIYSMGIVMSRDIPMQGLI
jgi:hypothetical protein